MNMNGCLFLCWHWDRLVTDPGLPCHAPEVKMSDWLIIKFKRWECWQHFSGWSWTYRHPIIVLLLCHISPSCPCQAARRLSIATPQPVPTTHRMPVPTSRHMPVPMTCRTPVLMSCDTPCQSRSQCPLQSQSKRRHPSQSQSQRRRPSQSQTYGMFCITSPVMSKVWFWFSVLAFTLCIWCFQSLICLHVFCLVWYIIIYTVNKPFNELIHACVLCVSCTHSELWH